MLKVYQVRVNGYIPYPVTREYAIRASGFGVAANRAMRNYRHEEKVMRKKMKRVGIQIVRGHENELV